MEADVKTGLREALLRGDRAAFEELRRTAGAAGADAVRLAMLRETTAGVIAGELPFCQLAAICQAAAGADHGNKAPALACTAAAGSASQATEQLLRMLLRGWGVPVLLPPPELPPEALARIAAEHGLRALIVVAFTQEEAAQITAVDAALREAGVREHVRLLLAGVTPEAVLPVDNTDFRLAAAAQEAATWR